MPEVANAISGISYFKASIHELTQLFIQKNLFYLITEVMKMEWKELDVSQNIITTTKDQEKYVDIRKDKKSSKEAILFRLFFSFSAAQVILNNDTKFYKLMYDIDQNKIAFILLKNNQPGAYKISIAKNGTASKRATAAFTQQFRVIKKTMKVPEFEKSIKYEIKDDDDMWVIDLSKPVSVS